MDLTDTGSPQQKMSHMRIERVLLVPTKVDYCLSYWNAVIIQNSSGYIKAVIHSVDINISILYKF